MKSHEMRLVFLCQSLGPLFRQLTADLADTYGPSILFTGSESSERIGNLLIRRTPRYRSDSVVWRLITWTAYMLWVLVACLRLSGHPLLFAVTNPPFNPWLALLLKWLRRWPYAVLVWDIYPDLLVRFGYLSERNLITRFWNYLNRQALTEAEVVITIGEHMANTIRWGLGKTNNAGCRIEVIPMWTDVDWIRPLPKSANSFAKRHGQVGKLTVLYSGNMGATHDLDTLLEVAYRLRRNPHVAFLLIGDGTQRKALEQIVASRQLSNVTMLPWQPEEVLPYSLATGDVAVVSLDRGAGGLSMPSKTYFMMAAGCGLVGVCHGENDLRATIETHECGVTVEPGNVEGLAEILLKLQRSPELLRTYRRNARLAAERHFSAQVCTAQFRVLLASLLSSRE